MVEIHNGPFIHPIYLYELRPAYYMDCFQFINLFPHFDDVYKVNAEIAAAL